MKTYDWILFDADDTLFHFDDLKGLQRTFEKYNVEFTLEHYHTYKTLNKALWTEYQQGKILATDVQQRRFQSWATQLNVHPQHLNDTFLNAMIDVSDPIHGAQDLLDQLHGKIKCGIITNGFTSLQEARLQRTGFKKYFDVLVISEQVGVTKPHRDIFDYALLQMGGPDREKILMVGDTYETDILGGINAGFDTCWINAQNKLIMEGQVAPSYQVTFLPDLLSMIKK